MMLLAISIPVMLLAIAVAVVPLVWVMARDAGPVTGSASASSVEAGATERELIAS